MAKEKKEKVKEVFEVSKNSKKSKRKKSSGLYSKKGDEKIVEKEGTIKIPSKNKGEDRYENKLLRNILIIFLLIFGVGIVAYYSAQPQINFNYKGVEFTKVPQGKLVFYQTSIPVENKGQIVPYNFFLRTKPTELEKILFPDSFTLMKNVVISTEKPFNCNGDGIIAVANLAKLHQAMGINFFKDENATCDEEGRYEYLTLKPGEKTEIVRVGNNCYDLIINNCEILPATEKLMAEMMVEYSKM